MNIFILLPDNTLNLTETLIPDLVNFVSELKMGIQLLAKEDKETLDGDIIS